MSSSAAPTPIESPCIDVCVLDERTGMCEGCLRTGEEIARWIMYTPDQRRQIMSLLPGRALACRQDHADTG